MMSLFQFVVDCGVLGVTRRGSITGFFYLHAGSCPILVNLGQLSFTGGVVVPEIFDIKVVSSYNF